MEIPKNVISYVRENIRANYAVSFVGEKEGVFCYSVFVPNSKTGFPRAVLLDGKGGFSEYGGFVGLNVISEYMRD